MQRQTVDSSNMASVGHDSSLGILEVEFHNGSIYRYIDVPREAYEGLMAADSKGKYLNANIKGTYNYEKVG